MGRQFLIDYRIYCPSYRRGSRAISHNLFHPELFSYVVREEEVHEYRHLNQDIQIIPHGKVSNISDTRNWILENKRSEYVVMVDDDMLKLQRNENRINRALSKDEIHVLIQNGFTMAKDVDAGLWGMNVNWDPKCYRTHYPFNLSLVVLGPFLGILDTEIRYDPRLSLKEDYDFFLQQLNKHRAVLRFNYLN